MSVLGLGGGEEPWRWRSVGANCYTYRKAMTKNTHSNKRNTQHKNDSLADSEAESQGDENEGK